MVARVRGCGGRGREPMDMGVLLVSVAALLNAGATPQRAWSRSLGYLGIRSGADIGDDAVPPVLLALASPGPGWARGRLAGLVRWCERVRGGCAADATAEPAAETEPRHETEMESRTAWQMPVGVKRVVDAAAVNQLVPPAGALVLGEQVRMQARVLTSGLSRDRRAATTCAARAAVAACRLSARLGAPLAQTLDEVAAGVAEAGRAEAARRGALAGPRATARVLAVLPVVGLALGVAVGAHPQEVLLGGGAGSILGVGGMVMMVIGAVISSRMVRAAQEHGDWVSEEVVVDLAAAALGAGASVPGVLVALGEALGEHQLAVVGRCLLLGAGWDTSWQAPQDLDWLERRRRLEQGLRPGWEDGAGVVGLLRQQAQAIRDGRAARDEQAAARLAVRLVLPLGLFNLPAFLCLGVVPVIVSLGSAVLAG